MIKRDKKDRKRKTSTNKRQKNKPLPMKMMKKGKEDSLLSEKGGRMGEGSTIYRTTIVDRMFSKATFDMLDLVSNFSVHENTIFSKEGYSRVYNILKYPPKIYHTDSEGYIGTLLDDITRLDNFKGHVDFFFESYNKPYRINFDKKTESRRQGLERLKTDLETASSLDSGKGANARTRELAKYTQDVNSFRYAEITKKLNSHKIIKDNQRRGKTQIESFQFIRVVCNNKDDIIQAEKTLIEHTESFGITIRQVKDITNYLETFSPVAGLYNMNKNNIFIPTIFTSDGYSKLLNTPTRLMENELQGLSRLLYVGVNIHDKEPLALTLTSSGEGQNIVIIGATGSGKTYLFENLAMQLSLHGFKLNCMDYKGEEYDFIADLIPNSVKLDFSNSSGFFANTLKFNSSLYGKSNSERKAGFTHNKISTVNGLMVLAGVSEADSPNSYALLSYLIDSIFTKHDVHFDDTYSYHKTQNINFKRDIYEQIVKLEREPVLWDRYGKEVCNNINNALHPYFFDLSPESQMFSEEFDLEEIITKDAIFYSFHMNDNSLWDKTIEYKIYLQDYITSLYIRRNKNLGHTTINSIEEYQRAVLQDSTKRIYNNRLSGGRSDNVISVIMSNTIAPLLQKDLDIAAIRENISTKFVSKVMDMDSLDNFCRIYNIDEQGKNKIMEARVHPHSFFVDYDTGAQKGIDLIQAIHPPEVTKLLETKRIDRQGEFDN